MAMAKFTVDTTAKLFIAKAGITSFNVQIDLYSDAKEHWLAGGAVFGFDFPIRTVAGDPRADASLIEPFYFMRDGWKIRPDEVDHTLSISGNIELDSGETGELIVPTVGAFTVLVTANTTNRGTVAPTAEADIAAAVWDEILTAGTHDIANSAGRRLREVPSASAIADAVAAYAVETGYSLERVLRIIAAAVAGKSRQHEVGAPKYRDLIDTSDQLTATTDENGNRTSVSHGG